MDPILQDLIHVLDLERLEVNLFRGPSRDLGAKSVFGGQVIGQALVAGMRTVENRIPHSLHAYFLRPGDMAQPIVYEVDRIRDGASFSARRIQAIQNGAPILSMMASFQKHETGLEHQATMPDVPPPESLRDAYALYEEWLDAAKHLSDKPRQMLLRKPAIEFRPVHPRNPLNPDVRAPVQQLWFRAAGQLPDDPLLHNCILAYATDFNLLGTALYPHPVSWVTGDVICASIDHALWFHRPVRVDEWLLYSMDSPTAQDARGLSRGLIYNRAGQLVASVAQESLMRHVPLITP